MWGTLDGSHLLSYPTLAFFLIPTFLSPYLLSDSFFHYLSTSLLFYYLSLYKIYIFSSNISLEIMCGVECTLGIVSRSHFFPHCLYFIEFFNISPHKGACANLSITLNAPVPIRSHQLSNVERG